MCLNCGDWICESEVCVAAEKARADQQATAGIPWRQRHFINYHDPAVERCPDCGAAQPEWYRRRGLARGGVQA